MARLQACWMCKGVEKENPLNIIVQRFSIARLNMDQYFRGYSFVVFKEHETELYRLDEKERTGFMGEMVNVASALDKAFKPDKMNYELLGNSMPHLHWHLIPRYKSEPSWGEPIWQNQHLERRLSTSEYRIMIARIRLEMGSQTKL